MSRDRIMEHIVYVHHYFESFVMGRSSILYLYNDFNFGVVGPSLHRTKFRSQYLGHMNKRPTKIFSGTS